MRNQVNITYLSSPDAYVYFDEEDNTQDINNVANLSSMSTEGALGYRGLHLSKTEKENSALLNGSYKLYGDAGYAGYSSSQLSNASSVFAPAVVLTFQVTFEKNFPTLFITFDKACNQYATHFTLQHADTGATIEVQNSHTVAVVKTTSTFWGGHKAGSIRLNILGWSTPYTCAKVSAISTNYYGVYTGKDLIRVVNSENAFNAQLTPHPGICEQYADIEVYDRDYVLHELVKDANASADICVFDDQNNMIGSPETYVIVDIRESDLDSVVTIACKDVSCTFEKINVPALPVADRSADELFSHAFSFAPNVSWRYYNDYYRVQCGNAITPNSWTYACNLKELLNKICIMSGTRVYYYRGSFVVLSANNLPYEAGNVSLPPNVYMQGAKLTTANECRIDTVNVQPINNALSAEDVVLYSKQINTVTLNNTEYNLPVGTNVRSTHHRSVHNYSRSGFVTYNYAKARIECLMVSGSFVFNLSKAPQKTPSARVSLQGATKTVERGASTYNAYPTVEEFNSDSFNLAAWINDHKSSTSNTLTWSYENERFSINPWIINYVAADLSAPPTAGDILTTWADPGANTRTSAQVNGWTDTSNFGEGSAYITMLPTNPSGSSIPEALMSAIRLRDLSLPITCKVERLSDTSFEVYWKVPIRIAYAAASRTRGLLGAAHDLDNYAILDNIDTISIDIIGKDLSDDVVNISYSKNDEEELVVDEPKNVYPFALEKSELLTVQSTRNGWPLTQELASTWLNFYDHPVQIFKCSVSARWAIEKQLTVGMQFRITKPDGKIVKDFRNLNSSFSLVNIEKRFENAKYTYDLQLIERTT